MMTLISKRVVLTASIAMALGTQACDRQNKGHSNASEPPTLEAMPADVLESSIGVLRVGERACTAFFTDTQELTTAYHCVESAPGEFFEPKELKFKLSNGQAFEVDSITTLIPKKDMAKIRVKTPSTTFLKLGRKSQSVLSLAAFDVDSNKLSVQNDCLVEEDIKVAGVFAYKCQTKGHYSGAPIFEGTSVVGMHLGYKPKVDRRVAVDFSILDDEQTDVLEVDYIKEGCHSRIHIRGGAFGIGGHNRAHIRGCNPIDIILDAISVSREEGDDNYQVVTRDISEIKENTSLQVKLLKQAETAYNQFIPCIDKAKAEKDKDAAENCLASFKKEMNTIIGELKAYFDQANNLKLDDLTTEARKFVDETHRISKDLINVWENYVSCSAMAVEKPTPAEKSVALKGCNSTLRLEFERINVDIKSLDINIIDTF